MTDRSAVLRSQMLIGSEWVEGGGAGSFDHVNPATGQVQKAMPVASRAEVDAAVAAARAALPVWRDMPGPERRARLFKLAQLMRDEGQTLGDISSLESGIPNGPFLGYGGAAWLEEAASWTDKLSGEVVPMAGPGEFDFTLSEPIGVVAVILTWNAPVMSIGMCVGPALAAGCTVVLKPSELAPFSSVHFGKLCLDAGLPPGTVNVVTGLGETGDALVRHPGVDKISFTGGTATARKIAAACAETLKPAVFELGGKSANIVFADADLLKATMSAMQVISLSGQGCTLPTRLLVEDSFYDEFVGNLVNMFGTIKVGDPFEPGVMMGPVINETACDRILGMIDRARETSKLLTGGERLGGELANGYFIPPTVFGDVDPSSELSQTEVFGPVLAISRFKTEDEAIEIANSTPYGLAAYVQTQDVSRMLRVVGQLDAGNIGANGGGAPAGPSAPFGGIKQSGYGKEGGLQGVREFVRTKNVHVRY